MELIAAVDRDWAIGRGEELLFSIPEDLARFKSLTWGKAIVYGRKTMITFPGGKPLPGRKNYVLTHQPEQVPAPARGVASVEELLEVARQEPTLFVAGGEQVYRQLLPFCDGARITQIDAQGGGDRFLSNLDRMLEWQLAEASEWKRWQDLRFRFCRYLKKM